MEGVLEHLTGLVQVSVNYYITNCIYWMAVVVWMQVDAWEHNSGLLTSVYANESDTWHEAFS